MWNQGQELCSVQQSTSHDLYKLTKEDLLCCWTQGFHFLTKKTTLKSKIDDNNCKPGHFIQYMDCLKVVQISYFSFYLFYNFFI